ncbi:hexadecenal dehydrogenase NDAI_0H02390 [Naumovozyma dairenensis CBS 421]|uniref:Aldehyde dehydrogenase n=1 Tax=Naumovozyma dairenensis (strain ATCC 10597 / BCRC 20456 / CBS 421 / NBRC 0211 / NRRL Y-12639) TaxID=1071378 RepID=G0WF52_NAUDC|nr:hypothetical protein NDAI_0H02390 [Naumovozyma dairenensis CBS 421]CCD26413.1 hypothetical protein NDAI_0H02390 [Naumovozyma dairenensis CBS 421]
MTTLQYTPLDDINSIIKTSKEFYLNRQIQLTKEKNPFKADLEFRIEQLKKFYNAIATHEDEIIDALFADYHRAKQESIGLEINPLLNNILHIIKNLRKWMKPTKVSDCSPPFMFGSIKVEKIARGNVLVIAPFNFPILLSLVPVAHAIGAGNSVVLKPSEQTPHTSMLIAKILNHAGFPKGLVQIVQGSIDETSKLIKSKDFSMMFYTGSPKVGSIVAQEAAKNLIPCVLELGGKSPTFITKSFSRKNLKTALRRIFFGSFGNSGQICVAPDYLVIHESLYDEAREIAKELLKETFPLITKDAEYTHMISERSYNNALKKLENTQGTVYQCESSLNSDSLCIPPTLIFDCNWDDTTMLEENFSPILPIIKYTDLDKTLDTIIDKYDAPLVQYIFSSSKSEISHILMRLRSGDCIIGDTLIHVGIKDSPFGGIGHSGYGNYGGIYGFNAFTHERTIFTQPFWMDFVLSMRYQPYNKEKQSY